MKTFIALIAALAVGLSAHGRQAIVVAHYGSSDDETRSRTIDLITADIRAAFPDTEVREAYISPVVRRSLAKRGIETASPTDALLKLRAEGYDTVYVQSTTIIDGAEMAEVRRSVESVAPFFGYIALGRSLCYSPDDCRQVTGIMKQEACGKDEAVVYVGHGNMLPSTATYSQLDVMASTGSNGRRMVSTIEGYPTAEVTATALERLGKGIKRVKLVPLLLVCGNHTRHDIAGEFAEVIRTAGYETEVVMRGLAENPEIRAIYVERVRQLMEE